MASTKPVCASRVATVDPLKTSHRKRTAKIVFKVDVANDLVTVLQSIVLIEIFQH